MAMRFSLSLAEGAMQFAREHDIDCTLLDVSDSHERFYTSHLNAWIRG